LTGALGNSDPCVRERVALGLARFDKAEAAAPLRQALNDSHSAVRAAAARSLETLNWHPQNDLDEAAAAVARRDLVTAAGYGSAAVEPLLTVLRDTSYPNRSAAVTALAETGDTRATKALMEAARDADSGIRVAALEALGDLNDSLAVQALRNALRDADYHVRATAAEVVGRTLDTGAVDVLLRTLKDAHWEVRKASVEALVRLKEPRALGPLVERLKDSDHDVRLAVVEGLGQLERAESIEALTGALADEHASVRSAAENALRRTDSEWEQSASAQAAVAHLKAALKSNDYWVRQAAANTLTKIGGATLTESAPATLSHASHYRRQAAVDLFTDCLGHEDRDLRLAAVEALGCLGDPRAHVPVSAVAANTDEDQWVRAAAERALPRLVRVRPSSLLPADAGHESNKIVPVQLWREDAKQCSR